MFSLTRICFNHQLLWRLEPYNLTRVSFDSNEVQVSMTVLHRPLQLTRTGSQPFLVYSFHARGNTCSDYLSD
jgi:hypothetical protein